MEKIVIIAGDSEADEILVSCPRMLFSEVEIQILLKEMENFEGAPNATERSSATNGGKNINST